ncbi:MAG: MscS Mechanosensitive ion channel [Frankiales bacterium]|nr:MscS Mechanosensitive ion channel [Frankiales bacterium]
MIVSPGVLAAAKTGINRHDVRQWFDDHSSGIATHTARVLIILVLALVVRALLHRAVRRVVRTALESSVPVVLRPLRERARGTAFEPTSMLSERRQQRAETLGSVLRSIASFTVGLVAGAMLLSELGLDLTPVVASAGIVGVAVGFGAQAIVKDFLTGIFMLMEDQYGVGDVNDAGAATGTVESVTLRTTRLRDLDGTVWHLRNGEILRVGNRSQGWARAVVEVPLSTSADLPAARALVLEVAEGLWNDPDFAGQAVEQPEVWGVESIASSGLVLRVAMKTSPLHQWPVERALRERILVAFQEHGITLGG